MFQERRREGGRGDEAWRRGKKEALTEEGEIRMGNSRGTWMGNEVGRRVRAGRRI
jgi:hypothetical protein